MDRRKEDYKDWKKEIKRIKRFRKYLTMKAIAEKYGVSRGRIYQVLKEYG
ncbi:MAG: hypothetical protein GQ474_08095 [Sulfurimonas sp.]|nr:hypothetical protein [Sulfurimonas sp.]